MSKPKTATPDAQLAFFSMDTTAEERRSAALTPEAERLLTNFETLAEAPEGIKRLRELVLELAVRGKLVAQGTSGVQATTTPDDSQPIESAKEIEEPYSLPAGWHWTRVASLYDVAGGFQKTPRRAPVQNHFPYLRVENVQRGRLDLARVDRFELVGDELLKRRLEVDDILVVEGNGSETEIGRCAVWGGEIADCVHQNHIIRCRPKNRATSLFTVLFFNSPSGMSEMRRLAITTSGLFSLSVGKIRDILVPDCPLAEQARIVAKVDEFMALCNEMEARQAKRRVVAGRLNKAALGELTSAEGPEEFAASLQRVVGNFESLLGPLEGVKRLRLTILELAAQGKLVPQDSREEPAQILAKRVSSERKDLTLRPIGQEEQPFRIPSTWSWVRGALVFTFTTSGSRGWAEYYSTKGPIFLRIGNLDYGTTKIDLTSIQRVSPPDNAEGLRTRTQPGDILISITGDTGMVGLVPESLGEAYINQHIALARPSPHVLARFIALQLTAPFSLGRIQQDQRGIKNSLGLDSIKSLLIALPPLTEQARIVAKVDHLMSLCDTLEAKIRAADEGARRLAESLVAELIA